MNIFTEPISIVVACDDHYLIMLAAMLRSIEKNHKTPEPIHVYIVEDNVSQRGKKGLIGSVDKRAMHLHWIKMEQAIPKDINFPLVPNTYPLNTYIRLFIPYFIPANIEKVLFMDVDMIVQDDISKLWHTNIGDHIIGAVTDPITRFIGNVECDGIANYKELGLDEHAKFFNAGLQLINIPEWKKHNITEKVINCINDNRKYARMGDQYGLNVVLCGKYCELDPLWNYMANGEHPKPYLIHFIHRKPFYKSYFNNPQYQAVFYQYLAETKWKNSRPVGESKRYFKKLSNVFQKVNLLFAKRQKLEEA